MDQQEIITEIELRARSAGITIKDLCQRAGVHPTTFTRWKRSGKRAAPPRSAHMDRIEALDRELAKIETERN